MPSQQIPQFVWPTTSEEGRLIRLHIYFLWCIYSNRVIKLFLINLILILQPQLQITTSTKRPMFGGNIILHVRSNFVLEDFHCVVTTSKVELVFKELNHFGVIAGLFRQIGGHSSRFVLFCSFWRLFTMKMIKSVKVFPFSFWKIITIFFFYFIKFKPPA